MKRFKKLAPLALAAALLAALVPPVSIAAPAASQSPAVAGAIDDGAVPETWMGALAAIGCGVFVRATIATGGTQAGTWAGAIACCGFMLFDALVLDKH